MFFLSNKIWVRIFLGHPVSQYIAAVQPQITKKDILRKMTRRWSCRLHTLLNYLFSHLVNYFVHVAVCKISARLCQCLFEPRSTLVQVYDQC